jgi:predicted RNA binding protein YcfA (HicA-like mRNA interferase family)
MGSRSGRVCIACVFYGDVDSREVLRRLEADGWLRVAQKGSHVQLKHPAKAGRVTVPHPRRDLPKGTLKSIERPAGLRLGS